MSRDPLQSLWRTSPQWRWLVALSALFVGLGLVGSPWRAKFDDVPSVRPASFEPRDLAPLPQGNGPAQPVAAIDGDPTSMTLPSRVPGQPVAAPSSFAADGGPGTAQAPTGVTWMSPKEDMQPIVISGAGLMASAVAGGTYTALASRGVAEGRHYLELTLSVPPGQGGPSTWSGVGVVPVSALQHGRVFLPRISNGLAIPIGRQRIGRDGDILMLAIDLDRRLAYWGLNGEWMNGQPGAQGGEPLQSSKPSEQWTAFVNVTGPSSNGGQREGGERWIANFGATPFKYALPAGFNSYGSTLALSSRSTAEAMAAATMATAPRTTAPDALIGRKFQDLVRIQNQSVPLPEGAWTVVAHFRDAGSGEAVVLARLADSKLHNVIAINAQKFDPSRGTRAGAFAGCTRQDYLFQRVDRYEPDGDQRCWWINHAAAAWQDQPILQAAHAELVRMGATPPKVMMNVGFRRADPLGYATSFYYFDPAEASIVSTPGNWAESEWHRARIDADPARRAYADSLRRWGESWAAVYFASK